MGDHKCTSLLFIRQWGEYFILVIGLAVHLYFQVGLVGRAISMRTAPLETDDAYAYIFKAAQMTTCFTQKCRSLQDLRSQIFAPTSDESVQKIRDRGYLVQLYLYHPLHSVILIIIKQFSISWESAYHASQFLGRIFIALAAAYWLSRLFGNGAAGIAMFLLAFDTFKAQGLHYIVPSAWTLGIMMLCWGLIAHYRHEARWSVLACTKTVTYPVLDVRVGSSLTKIAGFDGILVNLNVLFDLITNYVDIYGNYEIILFMVIPGLFSLNRSQKWMMGIMTLGIMFVLGTTLFTDSRPIGVGAGVALKRAWLLAAIFFAGMVGRGVWVWFISSLTWVRKYMPNIIMAETNKNWFLARSAVMFVILAFLGLFILRSTIRHAIKGINHIEDRIGSIVNQQNVKFDTSQVDLMKDACDTVLYMNQQPMHMYLVNGAMHCGAIYRKLVWATPEQNAWITNNPSISHVVAFNYFNWTYTDGPGIRWGTIPLDQTKLLSYKSSIFRRPQDLRFYIETQGDEAILEFSFLTANRLGQTPKTVTLTLPPNHADWVTIPTESQSFIRKVSISLLNPDVMVNLAGLRVSPSAELYWPWDENVELSYIVEETNRSTEINFISDIVFNGEIYNYRELRIFLEKRGHQFSTQTDTEVILHLYEEFGSECIHHLNGIFAFAIWDSNKQSLFLARDPMGIKPLYYTEVNKQLIFGSELKVILSHPHVERDIDLIALNEYLSFDYVPTPRTILQNIYRLPPGHILRYDKFGIHIEKYWHISMAHSENHPPVNWKDYTKELQSVLQKTINQELVSDVPVGVFLSGGIDSSAIAALMVNAYPGTVNSYSIIFDQKSFDESHYARMAAKHIGTEHHELMLTSKMAVDLVPKIMDFLDEPFGDSSFIPTFLLSKFASEHVKVVLGGDGGDELFAGYPTLIAHQLIEHYVRLVPWHARTYLIPQFLKFLPTSFDNISFDFKVRRFLAGRGVPLQARHHRWLGSFVDGQKEKLFQDWLKPALRDTYAATYQHASECDAKSSLNQVLYVDMKMYLEGDILYKVDRASMANSLEVRVPFLNRNVIQFATRLPFELKLHRLKSKYILKKCLQGILPNSIINRPKKGFNMPVAYWLTGDLRELAHDMLSQERLHKQGLFHYPFIHDMLNQHTTQQRDHRKELWTLLVFQLWYDKYMRN
ncbi:MAG: asparagine synthase (glutamine-hydrolyzing) [Anaerolineaceae bacterium 4572_78]|nr:MAG: asparagine synthase (glutamine-hydrolyzing) [Anaerolineaceae bacterium 4572_78]